MAVGGTSKVGLGEDISEECHTSVALRLGRLARQVSLEVV